VAAQGEGQELQRRVQELEREAQDWRQRAAAAEARAQALEARVEQLTRRVQELTAAAAKRQGREPGPGLTDEERAERIRKLQLQGDARPENAPPEENVPPPPENLKGTIEKIDPQNARLVQLNVGSDQGLREGQLLDLYRPKPKRAFVGRLRVIETDGARAVAQVVRARATPLPKPQLGDEVQPAKADPNAHKKGPADAPKGGPDEGEVRPNEAPNPSDAKIRGTVTDLDPKNDQLVTLSVGADHGLKVGHTLEVYRTQPNSRYLGRVQVVRVMPHQAVAQRVGSAGAKIQAGDRVATSFP
jgi:hypothetical protein